MQMSDTLEALKVCIRANSGTPVHKQQLIIFDGGPLEGLKKPLQLLKLTRRSMVYMFSRGHKVSSCCSDLFVMCGSVDVVDS